MKFLETVQAGVVGLIAFALFLVFAIDSIPNSIALVGAERVLAGEVPYRDFWTMYAPGQFYLLALLFALFGTEALVSIVAGTLLSGLAVGLSYRLTARIAGCWIWALGTAALVAAAFLANGHFQSISSYTPTIFLVLLALNLLEQHFTREGDGSLIGAGLAVGGAALFKHDVGGYTALSMLCGVLVFSLLSPRAGGGWKRLRAPVVFGLAAAAPVAPVVAALAVAAPYDSFWDTIWFPATIFGDVRGEAYPSLLPTGLYDPWKVKLFLNFSRWACFTLPFLIWLASLLVILVAARRRQTRTAALGTTLALAYLFHFIAAHVQINTHIISMTFYAASLGPLLLYGLAHRPEPAKFSARDGLAGITVAFWLIALAAQPISDMADRRRPALMALSLPKVSALKIWQNRARALISLTEYVQNRVPPGQAIYVGLRRHDTVITSHPIVHFIVDRPPATRYHELHGGVVDTAVRQVEMIRDIRNKRVELIVLVDPFSDEAIDRAKQVIRRKQPQIGAEDLDAFIRANYAPAQRFEVYQVWLRKTMVPGSG